MNLNYFVFSISGVKNRGFHLLNQVDIQIIPTFGTKIKVNNKWPLYNFCLKHFFLKLHPFNIFYRPSAICTPCIYLTGASTWRFLHTMAAYYPDKPTQEQKKDISQFFEIFSKIYPCESCASQFRIMYVYFFRYY